MLDLIKKYEHLIKSFRILCYEQEGEIYRFKAQIIFNDDSTLFIKEYLFENKERKYAYHWEDNLGNLICRWDNARHWKNVSTFPHHKHVGSDIIESRQTSRENILSEICRELGCETPD